MTIHILQRCFDFGKQDSGWVDKLECEAINAKLMRLTEKSYNV